MTGDFCPRCDGTGERDFLSGARCYECGGTGWIDDHDLTDEERDSLEDFWEDFYGQDQTSATPPQAAAAASGSGGGACSGARTIMGTDSSVAGLGRLGPADDDAAEPGAGVGGTLTRRQSKLVEEIYEAISWDGWR